MANTAKMLTLAKTVLPANFLCKATDDKITAYLQLTLDDINYTTPYTCYTLEQAPDCWESAIVFGSTLFANMFLQVNYSLADMSWNDNGLSMTIDRHGKLAAVYQKQDEVFQRMKWNLKKKMSMTSGPYGVGYPRYPAQISQFMKIIFGTSYSR